ncbi:hypothetical protein BDW69DRAFT_189543 [Aspergillus filifer]
MADSTSFPAKPTGLVIDRNKKDLTVEYIVSFKITKLSGYSNFWKWERDLRKYAEPLDLWSYYTTENPPLIEPKLEDYFDDVRKLITEKNKEPNSEAESSETPSAKPTDESLDTIFTDAAELMNASIEMTRLRVGRNSAYRDTHEAFQCLSDEYRLGNQEAAITVYREILALKLEKCEGIDDFFNRLMDNVHYVQCIGGKFEDALVYFLALNSLAPDFNYTDAMLGHLYSQKEPDIDRLWQDLRKRNWKSSKAAGIPPGHAGFFIRSSNLSGQSFGTKHRLRKKMKKKEKKKKSGPMKTKWMCRR